MSIRVDVSGTKSFALGLNWEIQQNLILNGLNAGTTTTTHRTRIHYRRLRQFFAPSHIAFLCFCLHVNNKTANPRPEFTRAQRHQSLQLIYDSLTAKQIPDLGSKP